MEKNILKNIQENALTAVIAYLTEKIMNVILNDWKILIIFVLFFLVLLFLDKIKSKA